MAGRIDFWFDFASTYSYPVAMRIEDACRTAGVALTWRPFLLGPVFQRAGLTDSPFNLNPEKGAYMWRDVERLCAAAGLAFQRPSTFPRNSVLAARVALIGLGESWGPDFVRAVFHANFAEDRDISDAAVLAELLMALDVDADAALSAATAPEHKPLLRTATEGAMAAGLFGAPSFIVDDELFWGGDRLDAALGWAAAPP